MTRWGILPHCCQAGNAMLLPFATLSIISISGHTALGSLVCSVISLHAVFVVRKSPADSRQDR